MSDGTVSPVDLRHFRYIVKSCQNSWSLEIVLRRLNKPQTLFRLEIVHHWIKSGDLQSRETGCVGHHVVEGIGGIYF